MPGLLYPAYQKMYSAFSSIERFNKESNFFDNISCLDTFFSEYRNITFAVQSQLAHTPHFNIYEKNRDKYLTDRWFVEKRNETIHGQPFQLTKKITVDVFLPSAGFPFFEKVFSVENDTPLDSLIDEFKIYFNSINPYEVFFSVSFCYFEKDSNEDILAKLFSGIASMTQFMNAMDSELNENCPLCNQLKQKIEKIHFIHLPRDFLLTNDYVYYPDQERFERASNVAMVLSVDGNNIFQRQPITQITQRKHFNFDGTAFGNFTLQHALLRVTNPGLDIMPVFLIIYEDGTFDMDVFQSSIKTTMYRKINEISRRILSENISQVCFVSLYAFITIDKNTPNHSAERIEQSTKDYLVCASLDKGLNQKEHIFDGQRMEKVEYIAGVMKAGYSNILSASKRNMFPIWQAFNEKKDRGQINDDINMNNSTGDIEND